MDRNADGSKINKLVFAVALRKESVDRNRLPVNGVLCLIWSLSARRAWIEILTTVLHWYHISVALRKESVDRNIRNSQGVGIVAESLSARRAWIEIRYGQ